MSESVRRTGSGVHRRRSGAFRAGSALVGFAAAIGMSIAGAATAPATPDTVSQARVELDRITREAAQLEERHAASSEELSNAEKALSDAQADLSQQSGKVEELRGTLGQLVTNSQQTSGVNVTLKLITSTDDADFLDQMATIASVSSLTQERLARFNSEKQRLDELNAQSQSAVDTIAAENAEQAQLVRELDAKQAAAQAVLDRLTVQQRSELEAQRAAQAAQIQSNVTQPVSRDAARTDAAVPEAAPANSSRGAAVVAFARARVGYAYVYGATGPSAFDCSGLTSAAYASIGVSIPRTSQGQFGAGRSVSLDALQPGDLVFYYSGPSHVGVYIGGGQIVHASTAATGVKVSSAFYTQPTGARRYV